MPIFPAFGLTPHAVSFVLHICIVDFYYGYCGIPQHGGREAVSPTLVGLVALCSGYPGRLECFRVEEKM